MAIQFKKLKENQTHSFVLPRNSGGELKNHQFVISRSLRRENFYKDKLATNEHQYSPIGIQSLEVKNGTRNTVIRQRRKYDRVEHKIIEYSVFKSVKVSFDTIEWESGIDLDPEFVYQKIKKNHAPEPV
jgi:hypothetical protein